MQYEMRVCVPFAENGLNARTLKTIAE